MKEIPLVKINCPLCGSRESRPVVSAPDFELHGEFEFDVASCAGCGFTYTSVRPELESLVRDFYPEDYICFGGKGDMGGALYRKRMEGQVRRRCEEVKKHLEGGKTARLLEVGCAAGDFIKYCAKAHGWDVTGIEPDARLSSALAAEGFNVIPSALEDAPLPEGRFSAVCMFHVLEHLWDPVQSIRRINRALEKGGIVFIESPDISALARSVFGRYWYLYHLPRHLSHFSPGTLEDLFSSCGFEKIFQGSCFAPVVNVLCLQYFAEFKLRSRAARAFCSAKNPLALAAGILFDFSQILLGRTNVQAAVFRKVSDVPDVSETLIREQPAGSISIQHSVNETKDDGMTK